MPAGTASPCGCSRSGQPQAICERLANGESGTSIARDPAMPCYATILRWVRDHAVFQDMYVQARQIQADYLFYEARDVAQACQPGTVWVDRLKFDVIRWQAAKLAPRKYVERLAVAAALKVDDNGGVDPEALKHVIICDFHAAPNGVMLVAPPRNEKEEQAWIDAYGRPFRGPRRWGGLKLEGGRVSRDRSWWTLEQLAAD